jgi:hypothetical protein
MNAIDAELLLLVKEQLQQDARIVLLMDTPGCQQRAYACPGCPGELDCARYAYLIYLTDYAAFTKMPRLLFSSLWSRDVSNPSTSSLIDATAKIKASFH